MGRKDWEMDLKRKSHWMSTSAYGGHKQEDYAQKGLGTNDHAMKISSEVLLAPTRNIKLKKLDNFF